jgi:hypothetical protein
METFAIARSRAANGARRARRRRGWGCSRHDAGRVGFPSARADAASASRWRRGTTRECERE